MTQHAKLAYDRAKKRAGVGWLILSPELREALVCREIVFMILGQADETLSNNPALAHFVDASREVLNHEELSPS